jgi:MFS family permease
MVSLLVLAGVILALCMGLRQSLGLFLPPMNADLGISASAFSFAVALQAAVWGISQPLMGYLADRCGLRRTVIASASLYALGLALMGWPGGTIGLDLGGALTGLGIAGTGFGVLMGVVSRATPPERRSQALGTIAALGSLGALVLAPLGQWFIAHAGWRIGLLAFAALAMGMAILAVVMRDVPGATTTVAPSAVSAPLREVLAAAVHHRGYLATAAAFFACGFQLTFVTVHLPAYLVSCGVPAVVGATAMGLIGLCNTAGSYAIGHLGARVSEKRLLATIYLLRTLTILVFVALPVSVPSTLAFAAVMGLLWLGVVPLVSGLVGRVFGLAHFSTLYGFVFLGHQLGSVAGSLLGGFTVDVTNSYGLAWAALIGIGLLAFALQWPASDRPIEVVATAKPAALRPAADSA